MYVAVKGGEKAIARAHEQLARDRRGDPAVPEIGVDQIQGQLPLAVDRVMAEGSLYDPELAALAIKQAAGDLVEAIFLLRAYRTTLPRLGSTAPLETGKMLIKRRISATFKDIPGGQVLGPTFDYTQRLLDDSLLDNGAAAGTTADIPAAATPADLPEPDAFPRVLGILDDEGLIEPAGGHRLENNHHDGPRDSSPPPPDLTREPLEFPAGRELRLQNLARADEGFLLALGYATQRGFGNTHPFAGEIRVGEVELFCTPEELDFPVAIGAIQVTECEMINQFHGRDQIPPQFTRGYGLTFGYNERKAMSMALVDRALRAAELGEPLDSPARDEEFVLYHSDNVEASGFVQHLKLPHYVDFQSELLLVRRLRAERDATAKENRARDTGTHTNPVSTSPAADDRSIAARERRVKTAGGSSETGINEFSGDCAGKCSAACCAECCGKAPGQAAAPAVEGTNR
ncbi:MAG: carbon-phosphorus lyase complex subunit PhnI [Deltaproteobacteria bacterium]|nr:carbon-phosphorus lyase complex subunit PhnI [Candidatus Anaeroferrophillacea bacterium]